MNTTSHTHSFLHFLRYTVVVFSVLLSAGCGNKSGSVVDNTDNKPVTSAAPSPAQPAATVAVAPSPLAAATAPVGPVGQTTPTGRANVQTTPQPGDNKPKFEISGENVPNYKPLAASMKDPYPPQPTPTVVMKDGKIVQQWQAPAEVANLVNPFKDKPEAVNIGREYYSQRCADCHGKEGKGGGYLTVGMKQKPTNLASKMVQANTDGELYWKITNGKPPMPANRVRFTDEQRWYIVTYLRTFKP